MGRKWSETLGFAGFWRNWHADSGYSSGKSGLQFIRRHWIFISEIYPYGTWVVMQECYHWFAG